MPTCLVDGDGVGVLDIALFYAAEERSGGGGWSGGIESVNWPLGQGGGVPGKPEEAKAKTLAR